MNSAIKPSVSEHSTLTSEDLARINTMTGLWYKPKEYFNTIADSGMCNDIIGGYILLVLDKLELTQKQKRNINNFIYSVFEDYDAQQARQRYAERSNPE